MLRSAAHLRMAAKMSAAIFVEASGERFRKNRKDWNEPPDKRRDPELPEQGVKGNAVPFGGVKRRQSLIWGAGVKRPARVEGKAPPS